MRDYDDVSFVYVFSVRALILTFNYHPSYTRRCPKDELADADKNLDYRSSTKDGTHFLISPLGLGLII